MQTIKVTKMQGLGNDFVILDYEEYEKTGLSMPRAFNAGACGETLRPTFWNRC